MSAKLVLYYCVNVAYITERVWIYLAFSVHISFMLEQFLSHFKMASFGAHVQGSAAGLITRKTGKQDKQVLVKSHSFAGK